MAINLRKGQKIDLTKGGTGLKKVMVGLGWDEAEGASTQSIDCDASAILCGPDGHVVGQDYKECCVYFNNLRHSSGAIVHQGDNRTGEGEGDDEQIMVNLPEVPANIDKIVFVVNIYKAGERGQHFGMIENAFVRLVNLEKNEEICRYELSENYEGMTGLVVGEIYRKNGEWKFNAVGQPVRDASYLSSLVKLYR